MLDILAAITDKDGNFLDPSEGTVRRYWRKVLMIMGGARPRVNHVVSDALLDFIFNEYNIAPLGMYRMFLIATRARVEGKLLAEVSYRRIQEAYLLLGFHKPANCKNPIKYRCTYTALQANLIWHTNLHDYGPPRGPS
jgi:hypothetical protein